MNIDNFLPTTKDDMIKKGIDQFDFVYISGDAYVDHPSFGHAIILRVLENNGFKVGIIPQPRWDTLEDITRLLKPKYAFLVSSGNMDSMVNHYSVNKKRRKEDMYSPGGKTGYRPDRACIVYSNLIRQAYGDIPIVLGGIEASLRRFAHYDYWSDTVRRSILFDSRANIISYGMGEKSILEIANALKNGDDISNIRGIAYIAKELDTISDYIEIEPYEEVKENKLSYAKATLTQFQNQDPIASKTLVQKHNDRYLVVNPPQMPLCEKELDHVYSLGYTYNYHPMYDDKGGIPALSEVKFSITHNRGCFGECNFCALTFHQGRRVTSRSVNSVVDEATKMTKLSDFKGYIHDLGGPSANFSTYSCKKQETKPSCKEKRCLFPTVCKNMTVDHKKYLEMLRRLRKIEGIKKVFIRSGIRYDYLLADKDETFFKELIKHHVSGQLRVAPEHISDNVLNLMGKPSVKTYDEFCDKFYDYTKKTGKEQYVVPYLMSSHPGSTLKDALLLSLYIKKHNISPKQVQDFYPTPFTISTCMYYTEINPFTMQKVYVAKGEEKLMQRALLQYQDPINHDLCIKALKKLNRTDLIGFSKECLVRPRILKSEKELLNKDKTTKRKDKNNELSDFRRKKSITKGERSGKRESRSTKKRRH